MNKCLYCGTPFHKEDKYSCKRCGAPLPFIVTEDGEPKFEAMQAVADLMYRMPPPKLEAVTLRNFTSMKVDSPGTDVRFNIPRFGILSWIGVTAEDRRVVSLRLIINAATIIFDLPPLPLPLSINVGLLNLEMVGNTDLLISPAGNALPTRYTAHYSRTLTEEL